MACMSTFVPDIGQGGLLEQLLNVCGSAVEIERPEARAEGRQRVVDIGESGDGWAPTREFKPDGYFRIFDLRVGSLPLKFAVRDG